MHEEDEDFYAEDDEHFVSKSQLKREAQALTQLGKRITELSAKDLETIPLEPALRRAVDEARKIHAHGARKRQLLYLGKLLRRSDTDEIEAAFERIETRGKRQAAELHLTEKWRDRLIEEGDGALAELIDGYPDADRQQLRQLIRDARRQAEAEQPPRAARQLFKLLRELLSD
jgi:ribosome-associated protein